MKILPHDMTLPELALRFILSNSDITTTIPGMRKVKHVEANVAASEKGQLDLQLLKKLQAHRWDRKPSVSFGYKRDKVRPRKLS